MGMIRRLHQHSTVIGVQTLMYRIQNRVGLFFGSQPADDCPALGIEPEICLRVCALAYGLTCFGKSTDKPVLVPAQFLHKLAECFLLTDQLIYCGGILLFCRQFFLDGHGEIELERHEAGFTVCAQTQAVIPVCIQAGRHPMRAEVFQRKVNGTL